MSEFNFSVANTSYLMTAINMINEDPVSAKIMLGVNDATLSLLKDLTPEEIRVLGNLRTPLMEIKMDAESIKDLQAACGQTHKTTIKRIETLNKLNDRLLLKVS